MRLVGYYRWFRNEHNGPIVSLIKAARLRMGYPVMIDGSKGAFERPSV